MIGHITHLEVLLDRDTLFVTHTSFTLGHHSIACIIRVANIAVDALPARLALTGVGITLRSVVVVGQRTTQWNRAVIPSKSRRTGTFSVEGVALRKVCTVVVVELAVEANWALGASGWCIAEGIVSRGQAKVGDPAPFRSRCQ